MTALYLIFWISAFIVFYAFVGYGLLLWILVWIKEHLRGKEHFEASSKLPQVTLLIAAYNEEDCIAEKMKNCLSLDYPSSSLHIVWVTDGSSDRTPEILASYPQNTVLHSPERKGKTAALNRAMKFIDSEIVVMTDANTELNSECISRIVRKFDNPKVGCVCGEKRVRTDVDTAAGAEGIYWKYECFLKDLDDRLYSTMGAVGELIAIRRSLWEDIPADTLVDDMLLSMGIVRRGYRIAYCHDAYALESPSASIAEERKRKVRLGAGGFQATFKLCGLLNPFRYGVVAFQFFSHRVIRWTMAPSALLLLLLSNAALCIFDHSAFYLTVLALQTVFYVSALLGMLLDRKGKKTVFRVPYYFLFANFSTFAGFRYYLKFNGNAAWEKAKRS